MSEIKNMIKAFKKFKSYFIGKDVNFELLPTLNDKLNDLERFLSLFTEKDIKTHKTMEDFFIKK
ncbi:MAG: hypothetical protein ACTSP9_03150 [Promethearchaeota archaeon]